ncbi:unnamed protein product [Didymodactylos carnosus]|uniref:PRP28/DDX23-like helical domain-containing protein n=1 Tax=Didymodactylos carnosus TaxID=1234261 RepID=A0A815QTV9_9BILA|nr:unnamed protein product [Didymodactylos carnosus]CAF4336386.1 unnamed protein product [Didymodactylos carnosus]
MCMSETNIKFSKEYDTKKRGRSPSPISDRAQQTRNHRSIGETDKDRSKPSLSHRSHYHSSAKSRTRSTARSRSPSPDSSLTRKRKIENETTKRPVEKQQESNGTAEFKVPAAVKRVPLSLEEMVERNRKEQEAIAKDNFTQHAAKPKFLTKEERQAEAMKRRQEEVDKIRKHNDDLRRNSQNFINKIETDRHDAEIRQRDRERERNAQRHQEREGAEPDRERNDRDKGRRGGGGDSDNHTSSSMSSSTSVSTKEVDRNREEEAVKERYLGIVKKKRKIRRLNDRKFVFDWDVAENTAVDYNPIYKEKHQMQFFGRGQIAGIDIKHQKRQQSMFYGELLNIRRTQAEKDREV